MSAVAARVPSARKSKTSERSSMSSLVVLTGRNRSRPTAIACAPGNTSMAEPIAVSNWTTRGEVLSVGSTVFSFRMSGSSSTPPRSIIACRTCAMSSHRLLAWKYG